MGEPYTVLFPSTMRLLLLALALMACNKATSTDADLAAATKTATAFIDATLAHDYAGMCATRTAAARKELTDLAGTCEKASELVPSELFAKVRAANARRRGDAIDVDLMQPGASKPALTLSLVREGDQWLIENQLDTPAPTAPVNTEPVTPLPVTDPDVIAAQATITAYFEAMSKRDYAGMCATRTAESRQSLASTAGTCETMMKVFTDKQPTLDPAGTTFTKPRRRGDTIAFDLMKANDTRVYGPLYLKQEGGRWLLFERDAAGKF